MPRVDADVAGAGSIVDYGDYAVHVQQRQDANAAGAAAEPVGAPGQVALLAQRARRFVRSKLRRLARLVIYPLCRRWGRPVPDWIFEVLRANQLAETAYEPRPSMLPIRFFRVGQGRISGRPVSTLGWARVRTHNHTPMQVLAGFASAATVIVAVFELIGARG